MGSMSMTKMPTREEALPGREKSLVDSVADKHAVNKNSMKEPFPVHMQLAMFGMGCFWGAEKTFWQTKGVYSTQVGYSAGHTKNPSYREVCSGRTGHNEVVRVVFDPSKVKYENLLQLFWEGHNPTQGMRQGNDVGTTYRSGIYYYGEDQKEAAESTRDAYQRELLKKQHGQITTEIIAATEFYYAEDNHQQYLYKNPGGYCGLGGTGVACPRGVGGGSKASGTPKSDL